MKRLRLSRDFSEHLIAFDERTSLLRDVGRRAIVAGLVVCNAATPHPLRDLDQRQAAFLS